MSDKMLTLKATVREKIGKNPNRRLRAEGKIPAVFYSTDGKNIPLAVKESELRKVYDKVRRTNLFTLVVEGDQKINQPCLIWDVEYYPTRNRFQHVDIYGVDLTKELKVRTPLVFKGTAQGVRIGGKLEVYRESIYIYSTAENLPDAIEIDLAPLAIGAGLRIADLAMPNGVRAHYDDNFAILSIIAPGTTGTDDGSFTADEPAADEETQE